MKPDKQAQLAGSEVRVIDAGTPSPATTLHALPETPAEQQALVPIKRAARALKAEPMHVEDIHGLAQAFPEDDLDEDEPISRETMLLAGAMFALHQKDVKAYRLAVSAGFKKIGYEGDLHRYDQRSAGLTTAALNAMASSGEGNMPSRLVYRLRDASCAERLRYWGRDRLGGGIMPRWFRRGPHEIAYDISYWWVVRGCWQHMRIVNGTLRTSARADIPTDAPPETAMGDEWKTITNIPQMKTAPKRRLCMVRNDVDVLAVALGYRLGFGNLLFQELLDEMLKMGEAQYLETGNARGQAASKRGQTGSAVVTGLSWAAVPAVMVLALFGAIYFLGG